MNYVSEWVELTAEDYNIQDVEGKRNSLDCSGFPDQPVMKFEYLPPDVRSALIEEYMDYHAGKYYEPWYSITEEEEGDE